jgi:hypothetical protein
LGGVENLVHFVPQFEVRVWLQVEVSNDLVDILSVVT